MRRNVDVTQKARNGWKRWRLFREIEPGHRFQTHYNDHRKRRERGETSRYSTLLNLLGGPALVVAGFAFVPTPGPSYIIIVMGLWMLAGELRSPARVFDRTEVRLRRLGRWVRGSWAGSSTVVKAMSFLAIPACIGSLAFWLFL